MPADLGPPQRETERNSASGRSGESPAQVGAILVLNKVAIWDPEACLYIFSEKIKEFQPSCRDAFM